MARVILNGNYLNIWGNPINNSDFRITIKATPFTSKGSCLCGIQRGDKVDGRSPSIFVNDNGDLEFDSYSLDGKRFQEKIKNVFKVNKTVLITWEKKGQNYFFYIDGRLVKKAEAPLKVKTTNNYYIGDVSGTKFNGMIDFVEILNKDEKTLELNFDDSSDYLKDSSMNSFRVYPELHEPEFVDDSVVDVVDFYTTEETLTSKIFKGKPVYRKLVELGDLSHFHSTKNKWHKVDFSIDNMETQISAIRYGSTNISQGYYQNNNKYQVRSMVMKNCYKFVFTKPYGYLFEDTNFIVEYTKKTV